PLFLPIALSLFAGFCLLVADKLLFHRPRKTTPESRKEADPAPDVVPVSQEEEIPAAKFRPSPKPRLVSSQVPAGSVSDYVLERVEPAAGYEVEFVEMYNDYLQWCETEHRRVMTAEQFAEVMKHLC